MPIQQRSQWKKQRIAMEESGLKMGPLKDKTRRRIDLFYFFVLVVGFFLKITGLSFLGNKNAKVLELNNQYFEFENLPKSFDGYTIMHLSDLHLDERPEMRPKLIELMSENNPDLIVLTGDLISYSLKNSSNQEKFLDLMLPLIKSFNAKDGVIAICGNHDSAHLVDVLERENIKFLCNELIEIKKGDSSIQIIGTDDPHYFYSPNALEALKEAKNRFSVGLIHSPELYKEAEESEVDLYLCGHTHAGQIQLPFKIAPIRRVKRGREYFFKRWQHKTMQGYTSSGIGTSGIPVRFNTRAEVIIHTLKIKS